MLARRIRKLSLIVFFSLSALLLLIFTSAVLWVITGPRSLAVVTPYIESALSATDGSYKVNIGSSELTWDGWENPLAVHIIDVKVSDPQNAGIAAFPEISLRMNLFKLLLGKIDIKSVEVDNPSLLLFQAEDGSVSLGFAPPAEISAVATPASTPTSGRALAAILADYSADTEATPINRLKSIAIRHATIAIKNVRSGVFFESKDASLDIRRISGTAQGSMVLPIAFDDKVGKLQAKLVVNDSDKSIKAETSFTNVPSALLRELFPAQDWMKAANMPLSGQATMVADFDGHVLSLPFTADAGPGIVDYPSQLEEKLNVKKIHLEGELSHRFAKLELKKGLLDFGVVALAFDGKFERVGDDYAIDAGIHSQHIPIDELRNYWPKSVSTHTRAWFIERISKGEVVKTDVALHFKPGELKLKDTPHDALSAKMDIKGATILYMPKNPPVTDVAGHLEFTGDSMDSHVDTASYLTGTKITSARVQFPNLNAPAVQLFMDMDLTAPAIDLQSFLALPSMNKAEKLNLTPDISGTAKGNAKLDFIAFSEHEDQNKGEPDIHYTINATLEDVAQPKFLHQHDVSNANMKVELDNKGAKVSGKANVNKLPMEITSETVFKSNETKYAIKTVMPVNRMPDFGLPKLDFVTGSMGVDASFVSTDTVDIAKAKLDLTRTGIALKEHGYIKKEGDKATLDIATARLPAGNTQVSHFALDGNDYEASGTAEIEKKNGGFRRITFDRLTTGQHDLDYLDYQKTDYGFSVKAKGKVLDLTPYRDNMSKGGKSDGIAVDVQVDKAIIGEKRALYKLSAHADCPDSCHSLDVKAQLADKTPFTYKIENGKLDAACDNAGDLLRALNVYDGMYGGAMTMSGQYEGRKITGKALIKDFTLKNAPLLTKIFTITSLTGIVDTLAGNGIAFDKMVAPFEYEQGNIVIKNAKQYGDAVGITATGAISLPTASYDITGTLVPSYTLNSLVGKIPLVGHILVGGEGNGLIALNYSIKGPMANPSISGNPLSVLTPGFTRDVFDIFDKPAPNLEQMKVQQEKADSDKEAKEKADEKP